MMSKEELGALIDSYADAKSTKNLHLIRMVAAQLESALDIIYTEEESEK